LLYLHGFRSSPASFKARLLRDWLSAHAPHVTWCCPQLPPSPSAAIDLAMGLVSHWPTDRSAVVGSSLGGFYATVIAERLGWPAVMLNPAVDPARDLAAYIGEQTAHHDPHQRFYFHPAFVDELHAMHPPKLTHPERMLAVIAKGDELLDWLEMRTRYAGARQRLIDGSDHALSDFDAHLPEVLAFLGLISHQPGSRGGPAR
jgi:predicted esterase YcpF (UPF0227 family)